MTEPAPQKKSLHATLGEDLLAQRCEGVTGPVLLRQPDLVVEEWLEAAAAELCKALESRYGRPVVLTALSNTEPHLNPFAGLSASGGDAPDGATLSRLVHLLAPGRIHDWKRWPTHFLAFSPTAVDVLADSGTDRKNALRRLRRAGGRLVLADSLFCHDPRSGLFEQPVLEPHEERRPAAWGDLGARLDQWLRTGFENGANDDLARYCGADRPVTLHITHSWGGGVAQWVESLVDADPDGVHLQLHAEGPETGQGCGQRYSLYLSNRLGAPVAHWWLQPPIRSTEQTHDAYRSLLEGILQRHGVGRVVVSSLIGHSLDALSTGLPTVQVLHDFYPAWPLLGIHPEPFLKEGRPAALSSALDRHRLLDELSDYDADEWSELGRNWRERVQQNGVRLAAPSRSVADLLRRLDPGWSGEEVAIIPHGLPRLAAGAGIIPRDRDDGRLRLVIPGRIQEGKGQKLLLEALPELTRHAQVCLLGAGKCGEVFFGQSGVDVIVQYRREELPALLATIGPHAAALLSVVPETFSYTLSEMFQLQIPVIATRVGSLAERVRDGENGWLIEPTADALIDAVRSLSADRSRLAGLRERMANIDLPDAADMAAAYDRLCPPDLNPRQLAQAADQGSIQAAALASQLQERQRASDRLAEENEQLQDEIEKRTQWAEERERARRQEVERRIRWVEQLEAQLSDTTLALQQSEEELHTTRETLEREQGMHRQTGRELDQLRATHEWVLGSRSWRATRPFRVAARFASNLGRAGAWNPLKWPAMLAHATRTIRTRGWRGALLRSQLSQQTYPAERLDTSGVEAVGDAMAPAGFPAVVEPDVSIVVPVHNQWTYTAACLRSLLQARCSVTFEVIVVDDLSTDETPGQLESIDGLVHLRNDENLGFVGSCQRGAAAAQGRYVVLLNNDTQVLDGWLDSLLDTFEQHPNTGLAGSRLIYPDGRLQEAGGIIFSDGSGWNYGKGANPDHPDYQFAREVDYCSGACIMLPASLYRELGGFDERYAPAYYEDTDLAFRVREAGYEVRVQPASTIVHHEGVTAGTDLSSGIKRHQVINRETFVERWAETLARHPAPIVDPRDQGQIRAARDHHLKGRILIVDAYTPEPDQDSGSLRLRYLMRCFQKLGYGVTFLPDNRAFAGDYTTALQSEGIEAVYDPFVGTLQRFFSERGAEFRFIMISRHYVASKYLALMKRYCPDARFIFDTVDLHYLREERQAELENSLPLRRTAAQTRRSELAVIRSADATLVVSPVEKTVLGEAAPEAPVHVISNVHEVVGSRRPFGERQDIFFVGGYQHPPNVDAALWFTRSIWPRIHEALPDIEFHLIGSKAPEQVRSLQGDGVRFQGFVEDLEPWLDGCRIAVAPLRYGAGIKGKVNISMSRGQPVVATPMAVEGMFAKPGRDVLVAETADAFADEVIRLYSDEELWNRVSVSGLENVRQYFSVETARLGLQGLIQSLESGK